MAIATDDTIVKFGTLDDLDSSSSTVADAAYSVAGDLTSWTNDDDVPMAAVVGLFTFGVAPTASTTIDLFARPLNIADTTKDADVPADNIPREYLGSFIVDSVTAEQVIAIDVALPLVKSSQEFEFYIKNNCGQTLSAGWSLQITPKSFGPHA